MMKHLFTALLFLYSFSACQRKTQPIVAQERYEYELMHDTAVFTDPGTGSVRRLADLPAGTRVSTYGPAPDGEFRFVDYNGYSLALQNPQWYATRSYKSSPIDIYKPIASYPRHPLDFSKTEPTGTNTAQRISGLPNTYGYTPSTGATIHTGPRGGHYYINSNGNKTYVKPGGSGSSRSRSSSYKSSSRSYRSSSSGGRGRK